MSILFIIRLSKIEEDIILSLVGKEIIEFSAQAYHNGEFITVTDEDVKGKWAVFCFYPADFSFVCPTELGDLQEQYEALKSLGVEVYSVSTDTHFVHKAWHDDSDVVGTITYPMIAVSYTHLDVYKRQPVGPRNMKEPIGRFPVRIPDWLRRIARLIAETASSWPITRL